MSSQVKPGSKSHRTQLRDRLLALGFPEETVAAQVAERLTAECQIRPRTAWRLAAELSLESAACHYNSLHGESRAGMRGSRIWEYEQWPNRGVRPTLSALRILAQTYATDWTSLLDLHDLEHLPPKDLAEYRAATTTSPAVKRVSSIVHHPRADGAPGPSTTRDVGTDDVGKYALAEAIALTRTNVDDVQLDDLWSDINYLGDAYARTTPDIFLRQLSLVRERAALLLKQRQRPRQSKDLYLMNAKCCAMMAWTSADLRKYETAQELNAVAWLYGQYAEDHLARRWVRTSQSRVEYWAGNAVESARLATDGLTYGVRNAMSDAALILAEARGWATVQAEERVFDAIGRWTDIEDSDSVVADEDRFFNVSKDRRHYMAGTALLSVGRTDLALHEFHTARQIHRTMPTEYRWEAMEPMICIDTGRAYLRQGELDGVSAELQPFLAEGVGPQPDMVRSMLKVVTKELSLPRWTKSKTIRDLLEALLGTQTSALTPVQT